MRVLGHGEREEDQLPLAQGELPGVATHEVPQTDALDGGGDCGPVRGACSSHGRLVGKPAQRDDLFDLHGKRQRGLLRHHGKPPRHLGALKRGDRRPAKLHVAGRRVEGSGEGPHEGRLAGAVGADEGHALARIEPERHVAQDRLPARHHRDAVRVEGRAAHSS